MEPILSWLHYANNLKNLFFGDPRSYSCKKAWVQNAKAGSIIPTRSHNVHGRGQRHKVSPAIVGSTGGAPPSSPDNTAYR